MFKLIGYAVISVIGFTITLIVLAIKAIISIIRFIFGGSKNV